MPFTCMASKIQLWVPRSTERRNFKTARVRFSAPFEVHNTTTMSRIDCALSGFRGVSGGSGVTALDVSDSPIANFITLRV